MNSSDWFARYGALKIERRGRVLVITLDNPPLNPMTPKMHAELARVFVDAETDEDSDVVVLTGGGRAFSAGGNVKAMLGQIQDRQYHRSILQETPAIVRTMLSMTKPLIGRINGHAIGLGATLALYCDLTIAVETAKIADMHVAIGLSAGDGGALIWPQMIGFARAKRYLLTGESMTMREAADIGLITQAVPAERLDEETYGLADRLAGLSPTAVRATKRSINMLLTGWAGTMLDAHVALELETMLGDDHAEALRAAEEQRAPNFAGR